MMSDEERLARLLCQVDGKVYWTEHIPQIYWMMASRAIADGWVRQE